MSEHKKPEGYYGIIYWNPDDKRIFVKKRWGIGWTINFGNPVGVLVLVAIVVVVTLVGNAFR